MVDSRRRPRSSSVPPRNSAVPPRQPARTQRQQGARPQRGTAEIPTMRTPRPTGKTPRPQGRPPRPAGRPPRRTATKSTSFFPFIGLIILLLAILALVLSVMGTHLEQGEPITTPQSDYDRQRQDIAISVARTEALAHALATDSRDAVPPQIPTELLNQIDDDAAQWLKDLGGIWVPWPDGAPKGYANPELDTTPTAYDLATLQKELDNIATTLSANTALDGRLAIPIATQARILQARLTPGTDYHKICHTPDLDMLAKYIGSTESLETFETARQWLTYDSAQTDADHRALPNARISLVDDLNEHILRTDIADTRPALVAPAKQGDASPTPAIELVASEFMAKAADATAEQREASVAFLCALSFPEHLNIQPQSSQEK